MAPDDGRAQRLTRSFGCESMMLHVVEELTQRSCAARGRRRGEPRWPLSSHHQLQAMRSLATETLVSFINGYQSAFTSSQNRSLISRRAT
jgi:hypothetical protein